MKVELDKQVRIKRRANHLTSSQEYRSSMDAENAELYRQEKDFIRQAKEVLRTVTPETGLVVTTQGGRNETLIRKYTGHLQRKFGYNEGVFNFISPDNNEGNPFAIGFSCLLSIEVL